MERTAENLLTPKRDVVVAFRLTLTEAAHVEAAGAALKRPRSRADFCRASALYIARQRVPEPAKPIRLPPRRLPSLDTQLLTKLLAEVGSIGCSLNHITRMGPLSGVPPTAQALATMATDVSSIRAAIAAALGGGNASEALS